MRASGKAALIAAVILLSVARTEAQTEEQEAIEMSFSRILRIMNIGLLVERIVLNLVVALLEHCHFGVLSSLLALLLRASRSILRRSGSLLLSCGSLADSMCGITVELLDCLSALLFSGFFWQSLIPLCASLSLASGPVKACGQLLVDVSG